MGTATATATTNAAIDQLLASDDPAVRYLTRVQVLGDDPDDRDAKRDRAAIPSSPRVRQLLSEMNRSGLLPMPTYSKWRGGHWVLGFLSEIGYPPGDKKLKRLADRCTEWALGIEGTLVDGRWRRCASQQSYAVLYLLKLGFYDKRCDELVDRLIGWQWPDGGWNCDKRPEASHASFHESLLPMRALFHYARETKRKDALAAANRAARHFRDRKLFRRKGTGDVIDPDFLQLHYPYHWRYNILHALKAMAEADLIGDRRCREAIDVLRSRQLPDGGFASPHRAYRIGKVKSSPVSLVDWGPHSATKMNPFVTIDALYVLRRSQDAPGSGGSS